MELFLDLVMSINPNVAENCMLQIWDVGVDAEILSVVPLS